MAQQLAELHFLEPAFDIIELARTRKLKPVDVSKIHFRLGDAPQLPWLFEQIDALEVNAAGTRWHVACCATNWRHTTAAWLARCWPPRAALLKPRWLHGSVDDSSLRFTLAMLAELAEQKTLDYLTVSVAGPAPGRCCPRRVVKCARPCLACVN